MNSPARLLLVDDHQLILDSLQLLFNSIPDVEVVGTSNDSRQVSDLLTKLAVDLIVCDLHMPHLSGIDLTLQIRQHHCHVRVLLLTMADDAATIREAVRVGCAGYVLKRAGRNELEKAITLIMRGQRYFSPEIIDQLTHLQADTDVVHAPLSILTEREIDVLRLIANEHPTHQIAERLFISVPTVETHRRHLMRKLGVKSVVGMVKFAMKHGLVA
ncbi:response regulator transcription factor [Fibrella sp. USSR17]